MFHYLDSLKPLWDAMTGIGTISLAVATFIVILQGRRLRKNDDQHHQDALRPICILTPYDGVDPRHWRDTLLTIETEAPRPSFGIIKIECFLRNVGPGPALRLGIMFRFHDMAEYTTEPWELGPLQAGECRGSKDEPLRVPIQFLPEFNDQDFAQLPGRPWELILVYEDAFENRFYTMHRKNPLQMNRLYPVRASGKFAAPAQPWVTLGKGTPPYTAQGLVHGFVPSVTISWWRRLCNGLLRRIRTAFSTLWP